ncbi:MAG: AAA family ATPase, partial [bacterium]|nr:AAA family ATPase [bacterium]
PRRFGKSLWLDTLANYYDLARGDEFNELFGDLEVGRDPTALRNRYFVMEWNFSNVDAASGLEQITDSLRRHVRSRAKTFAVRYEDVLARPVETDGNATEILESLLRAMTGTNHKLYLLIDEYDNFINDVMVRDVKVYRDLVEKGGPFKLLFKSVKDAMEGQGIERVFVTGVSPVALNDITSGFNIAK